MYLNAHTYFSLRYGTLSPERLVEAAAAKGVRVLALTDINSTSAALPFVRACERYGIKPVLGIEFRDAAHRLLYVGLARNRTGWQELCALLTQASVHDKPLPAVAPPELTNCYFVYTELTKPFAMFRDNEFVGIRPGQVHALYSSGLRQHPHKLVVFAPITFLDADALRLHKLLRAIDRNTLVTKLTPADTALPDEVLYGERELLGFYDLYPEIIVNTQRLLGQCAISFDTGLHRNRRTFTGTKESDLKLLERLALAGCKKRYGAHLPPWGEGRGGGPEARIRKELQVIGQLDFATYFLITWDIVRYAQSVGYHHVGRGSGANSIVAYCLGITDVEPLELNLYFERFINVHRVSVPDFDIDFSWDERDDVIEYVFTRYGREYTALVATYTTFQPDSAVRELARAFGLPKADVDFIVDNLPALEREQQQPQPGGPLTEQAHRWVGHILRYAWQLLDFPNYLSIHAGGIVIAEEPLTTAAALQMMPKGFPVIQLDMHAAEDWGYHKFDVLSQRGLGHIKSAVELVYHNHGVTVNIHDVGRIKHDERVRALLRSGRCMGCFYIESPAMRQLLQKLRCDTYEHLVAASSVIRPGVASMMRDYIYRFHHPYGFEYLHPAFAEHLSETFGVMIYQEDVMKILHHFAGLDLGESDLIRRWISGKKRTSRDFEELKQKYFDNCRARGYAEALVDTVWRQIESFGAYSFCKAHSASFAVESFQSLYLKAYYPREFMVAVLNNFGGFYAAEFYVHELRRAGATVHAPCVNHSEYLTVIYGTDVYLGFVMLKGLEQRLAHDIVRQRRAHGPFKSLEDFIRRVDVDPAQLTRLIEVGALRFTGARKAALLWEKNRVLGENKRGLHTPTLLEPEGESYTLPPLEENEFDQAFDEVELLGFALRPPFDLLEQPPGSSLGPSWRDLLRARTSAGKAVELLGYLVCTKDVHTKNNDWMKFAAWLDRDGECFDTVHFPDVLRVHPFRGRGVYRLQGYVTEEFGFYSIQVTRMQRLAYRGDSRYEG